ncbi:shikimate kinase [soil metagenome]
METAPNLVLIGPMGAGKTSIGRRLAARCGLAFVDADREIEARTGAPVATIFECEGEAGFRVRERAVLADLLAGDGQVVATGGGAVLDADSRRLLRERGFVVHLHASVEQQLRRLARDRSRPLLRAAGNDGEDRAVVMARLHEVRGPLYLDAADLQFDTGTAGPDEAAEALLALVAARWPPARAALESPGP